MFTISTRKFKTLKEVETQFKKWDEADELIEGSLVFEVKRILKPSKKITFSFKEEKLMTDAKEQEMGSI